MSTTRTRIVHVHGPGHAAAIQLAESLGHAFGLLAGLAARFLIAGSRAVVAAVRGL